MTCQLFWPKFIVCVILLFVFSNQMTSIVRTYLQYPTATSSTQTFGETISPSQITHCAMLEQMPFIRDMKTSAEMLEAFLRQNSTAHLTRFSGFAVPGFTYNLTLLQIQAKYFEPVITFLKQGYICQAVIAKPELIFIFEKLALGHSDKRMFTFNFTHPFYKPVDAFDIHITSPADSLWGHRLVT